MKIADDIMYSLFKDEEPTNAIDLLKFDHRNVNEMFAQCLKEEEPTARRALTQQIVEALTLHAAAEEKLVYPILNVQDEELSHEAYEEHHVMKVLIEEAALLNGSESNFHAKIKVLSEIVAHHVQEEEAHMLPRVQHSGFDMRELADKIRAEKESLRLAKIEPAKHAAKPKKTTVKKTNTRSSSKTPAKAKKKSTTKTKATQTSRRKSAA